MRLLTDQAIAAQKSSGSLRTANSDAWARLREGYEFSKSLLIFGEHLDFMSSRDFSDVCQ
jgi:hypothetical protein